MSCHHICPICQIYFEPDDKISVLACDHSMHKKCLLTHIDKAYENEIPIQCPVQSCKYEADDNWELVVKTTKYKPDFLPCHLKIDDLKIDVNNHQKRFVLQFH